MLRPNKNEPLESCLLFVSAHLLSRLQRRKVLCFVDLRADLPKIKGTDELFVPALNLLHSLGLVEYRLPLDAFEYVGPASSS